MKSLIENPNSIIIFETFLYLATAFILFFIGKVVYSMVHARINVKDELVKKDNLAFALAIIGYYIGLLLAIGSAIIGPSKGIVLDLVDIGIYGLLAIILLNLSSFINDAVILSKFKIEKEIVDDRNAGTGVVLAASYIASGLIIFGAVSGEGENFFPGLSWGYTLSGIVSAVSFWFIGQIILVITAYFYNLITPYNVHEHIEKDNVAVGIGFAGALISLANLVRHGISGDFIGWTENAYWLGIEIMIGLAFLPSVRLITDKVLLPGEKLTDEIINQEHPNIGAAMIEAFAYIGGSVIITWCL